MISKCVKINVLILCTLSASLLKAGTAETANTVIRRSIPSTKNKVTLIEIKKENGLDTYEFECNNGHLTVRGSSVVALCRGFYDYLKLNGLGQITRTGNNFRIPKIFPKTNKVKVVTPFEVRHAYNVVTAGYTFPYWTWKEWEKELDWQTMHGFNMLMAPIATEAIMERVWLKMGLTQAEIDENTCGPAHMPWYRMGNICGIDGHLPKSWHSDQIALQHKILSRMKELGIEPVIQGFNGFVPREAFNRLYPQIKLFKTEWNNGIPQENRPAFLPLDNPLFSQITKSFLDEWEKEFGNYKYVLIDSFNEMEVPKTDNPITNVLADYGQKTYDALYKANPDAIWVIQGWTFGYQDWPEANLEALFSKVPNDKMLVLDYANDYYPVWKKYKAFYGKNWLCGDVPNMGDKTHYTGNLAQYASLSSKILKDSTHRNLKGFTIEGEGLENNDIVQELLTDMAWCQDSINLDTWCVKYSLNRYGACPEAIEKSWKLLRKGCYSKLIPHPTFKWQHFGDIDRDPNFFTATKSFLSVSEQFKNAPLYKADAIERTALALGLKADEWYSLAKKAHTVKNNKLFEQASQKTLDLLLKIDKLLESHPLYRLERWVDFAREHGETKELKQVYESNAKCIVTYWTNGVQNYSARVWSGLIRDYYYEWLKQEFNALRINKKMDTNEFMLHYIKTNGISHLTSSRDPIADAKKWLNEALQDQLPKI